VVFVKTRFDDIVKGTYLVTSQNFVIDLIAASI
jgi:hypothetical protein